MTITIANYNCRTRGLRQHEAGHGLPRGRLGRVRRRGGPLPGDHGGPGREGSPSTAPAVASAELPPRAPAVGRALGAAPGFHDVDVHLHCQQLRTTAQHGFRRDAAWSGCHAAASGRRHPRLGPVPRPVSPAAAREALSTLGRGTGVLTVNLRRAIDEGLTQEWYNPKKITF